MKIMKVFALIALVYVGIVILFESFLGYLQPQNEQTLVLSVTDDSGTVHERVLSRIELEERLYVAVNHWPRKWFRLAMEKPNVKVTYSGKTIEAMAVQVTSEQELTHVGEARPIGMMFRVLTGFPPRHFVRLDSIDPTPQTLMPDENIPGDVPKSADNIEPV